MRFQRGLVAAVVAAVAAVPTLSRAAPIDWVLAAGTFRAQAQPQTGSGGGSFNIGGDGGSSVEIRGVARSNGAGPLLFGSGFIAGPAPLVDVFDLGNGGLHFRTTDDAGAIDIEITPAADDTLGFSVSGGIIGAPPGSRFALIVFVANGVIDRYEVKGGDSPDVSTGAGTSAIYAAAPGMSGVAVDASVASAGTSSLQRSVAGGLVGGVVFDQCVRCTIEWASPDGRHGSGELNNYSLHGAPGLPVPIPTNFGSGDLSFVGPAGAWSWSWTGVGARLDPSTAVVGAYAPVGDRWTLFAPSAPRAPTTKAEPKRSAPSPQVKRAKQTRRSLAATGLGTPTAAWLLVALAVACFGRLRASR